MKQADVCVIGAGPGGYVAAIKAAQLGKKVIVIEKDKLGGICLNVGCIPSKALITASHFYEKMHHCDEMGFSASGIKVDLKKLQTWKQGIVGKLTGGVGQLLKANGCEVLFGSAQFTSAQEVDVKTADGKSEKVRATDFIIATGSRPIEIPGFTIDEKNVLSSTGALDLTDFPKKMAVIGGGYIGLEIGSLYAKFGVEVTIIEAQGSLLAGVTDSDCANVVARRLKKKGVNVLLNAKAQGYKKSSSGLELTVSVDNTNQKILTDVILMTVGRRPNSENLGLEKIEVRTDKRGFIQVSPQLKTNVAHIYAIGDVAGQPMLAHKGMKEGIVVAEVIAGKNSVMDVKTIPAVVFTDPEIASAGLTTDEARARGFDVAVGQFPYAANGRALTLDSEGFVKIITDKKSGLVLGIHVVGYEASNLISEGALAIEMSATAEDIAATIHPHPTLPEMIMEAAEAALGHAVHIYQRPERERPQRSASKTT